MSSTLSVASAAFVFAFVFVTGGCGEPAATCYVTNECPAVDRCDTEARICVPAECEGTASSCETVATIDCEATGCRIWEGCLGTPDPCTAYAGELACNAIGGCYWSQVSDSCAGFAFVCGSYATPTECEAQIGCEWGSLCEGTPDSCRSLDADRCEANPGCAIIPE
jgi:hypothetical protein